MCVLYRQFKISNPFIVHRIPGVRPVKNLKQCVLHVNILYSLYNCTMYSVQYPWDQLNVCLPCVQRALVSFDLRLKLELDLLHNSNYVRQNNIKLNIIKSLLLIFSHSFFKNEVIGTERRRFW